MARHDYGMMTEEEILHLRERRRRFIIIGLAVLLLAAAAFFLARPTRDAIKGWQARRHARAAFALIEEEKWQEARNEAVAAYQLRQREPQALRAVARFLSRTRQQQALEFWEQLAQKQPLTREDLRDEAAIALVSGDLSRASAAVDQLLVGDGKQAAPRDWLLAAQLRLQQSSAAKAVVALQKVLADPGATARERLQATILQLQSARSGEAEADARNQSEARQRLVSLAQGEDAVALDALALLAQRALTQATPPGASEVRISPAEIASRLQAHPLAKVSQKLLALDLLMHEKPDERDALIARAIADWRNAETADLVVLATWLNGKGEYEQELETIPADRAVQSRELFLQRMDALGALGRWEEIKRLLDNERYPLDPVIQRMYLARTNAQLGQQAASENNWQRALEAAAGDPGKLMTLAEYAEKNGALEIAGSAYAQAIAVAPNLRPAWQGRLRLTYLSRETKRIHSLLAEMLQLWPNDPAVQNDEAYTQLLLLLGSNAASQKSDVVSSSEPPARDQSKTDTLLALEKRAQNLVDLHPASLPHRTLLALSLLLQQRAVAALQVYDGIQATPGALTPSALAVHAAVLAANGQEEAAREEIRHVSSDKLLPEEEALVQSLRD